MLRMRPASTAPSPPHPRTASEVPRQVHQAFPDINVTTCHRYSIQYKFRYQCTNEDCRQEYGRHSKSINTTTQGCGKCGGTLVLMGKFNSDGTPAKEGKANAYSLFVKEHFAEVARTR